MVVVLSSPESPNAIDNPLTRARPITVGDAKEAAAWIIRDFPVTPELIDDLPLLLARLVRDEVLRGEAIEYFYGSSRQPVLAGFGLTGFLHESYAAKYLAAPFPYLELDLLDRARESGGSGQFLDLDDVAQANAREGLTAVPLLWLQRSNDPISPETENLQLANQQSFMRVHSGYRLKRIIKETTADRAKAYRAGGFREHYRIPVGTPLSLSNGTLRQERVVFEAKRSDFVGALPGSFISHLFIYHPPRCGFTRFERQVLERAAGNLTDGEIAKELGISPGAVALRWRSIYTRFATQASAWFDAETNSGSGASRGREKRRRVISFVRDHPEELRPYSLA